MALYPASYAQATGWRCQSWGPGGSCRLSATGVRFLGKMLPPRVSAFVASGLPDTLSARTLSGFPRSPRPRYGRVGCPLYPGDGGALPAGC